MGIRYVALGGYANVGTTRYLTINSSLATRVTLTSGFTAMSVFNQGSASLIWGDSNITVNSGNYLFPSTRIEWDNVQDGFNIFLVSDSTGYLGIATVNEYRR
mgnify:CR=1 FL=1